MRDLFAASPFTVLSYLANYGYTDGAGTWYITIDTDKCDGCAKCVEACPNAVFAVAEDDYGDMVAAVRGEVRKNLRYVCDPCKAVTRGAQFPCQSACQGNAIHHSW
ncbi:MAG: ferredoxin family protein [Chloroflexi bacterium]|nr:ferredoxin family protein [Chloroflexota bacterium]